MAQKQFKIGLSNTDKQNMAQDVYERVLALTFNEYDTTTEYEVGDFVVYNDQLYKCISATSGAWDSSKWQLATLNDLVDDIENAVAFVNDKANVNGNYPTMTVGFADNLTPYDESSGDDQDEPFILQATGTGNGTQPDFATGSGALMKEKQGNTVVVNQKITNPNFASTDGWVVTRGTLAAENNVGKYTISAIGGGDIESHRIAQNKDFIKDHYYLMFFNIKSPKECLAGISSVTAGISYNTFSKSIAANTKTLVIRLAQATASGTGYLNYSFDGWNTTHGFEVGDVIEFSDCNCIDLTQWFNGDIPQDILDHPSNFFRYYQGSLAYNEGTLVNSNGRYIKCIGMNQWDEEWEVGLYSSSTGEVVSDNNYIRSKSTNWISVLPNATYYAKTPKQIRVYFYDRNKNYIGYADILNSTFATPSNCLYIRFCVYDGSYGTTYNNDISINLYYEDEPRCLTYEPYQVLTNNDTGNEVLRSAGSVKDSKAPDGTITRRIGVIDLGSLDWQRTTFGDRVLFYVNLPYDSVRQTRNIVISEGKYNKSISYWGIANNNDYGIIVDNAKQIGILDNTYETAIAFKTAMSGVYLFYELAEPTTEQGTPYSENVAIDDFGSMSFEGTNGVPQGANIFYPVDYKAFVDTLYKYTDGTPSNIALKSDLASDKQELKDVDTQLLNAVGGTLRQLLANANSINFNDTVVVDMSTLSWQKHTSAGHEKFYTNNLVGLIKPVASANDKGNIFSTKYETATANQVYSHTKDLIISIETNGQLSIYDASALNTHTSGSTFDPTLKGQLLAYEKASE